MSTPVIPAYLRGQVVASDLVGFAGRDGSSAFRAPDPATFIDRLHLAPPGRLADLQELRLEEIVHYLDDLGRRLELDQNEHLQQALALASCWSDLTPPVLEASYRQMPRLFAPEPVREAAEVTIGADYLDGWVERELVGGGRAAVRAFGARCVHVIAGNSPLVAAATIIRNAITRGDAIIKTPSNDPLTAVAIAQTMVEMAPDHPLTRHLAVAYWKGGDEAIETRLYQPARVEKIVAWGGVASVKHVTRYIQPGLELIALDPKRSATVIGEEAFADGQTLREVARRAATDIGALNQLACFNARVIYALVGVDEAGVEQARMFGQLVYEALLDLPPAVSTKAKHFDSELRADIAALGSVGEWYTLIGGHHDEGAVIVSHLDEPVDFAAALSGRCANVVPVADVADAARRMDAYTQTVGVYPDALKKQVRDIVPFYGAQRLVSLGHAGSGSLALPQDALEPTRRLVKWIVEETADETTTPETSREPAKQEEEFHVTA